MLQEGNSGQVAYEAYGEARSWTTFTGDPMLTWDEQDEDIRSAWEEAAKAVARFIGAESA